MNRTKILFGIVVIVFLSILTYRYIYKNEVKQNGVLSVAKVYDIYSSRRANMNVVFKYSYNKEIYSGIKSIDEDPNKFLNKYFKILISKKDPNKYIIYLDQPITDSLEILNSELQ